VRSIEIFHVARRAGFRRARLQPVAHPIPHPRVLDVLELGADRVRIDALERGDHLAQRHLLVIEEELRGDAQVEILVAEAELAQAEERVSGRLSASGFRCAIVWPSVR
jgi:hypothetical protein